MVIAIIALLISLLMPSLVSARRTAQRSACSSQLRQLGILAHIFAQDHGGYMPQVVWFWTKEVQLSPQYVTLARNYGAQGLLVCPAEPERRVHGVSCGYGINQRIVPYRYRGQTWENRDKSLPRNPGWGYHSPYMFSSLYAPSKVILFADIWTHYYSNGNYVSPRHNGLFNAVLADGHVRSLEWPGSGYWRDARFE